MEEIKNTSGLPDNAPNTYTKEEVEGKLADAEFEELSKLIVEFPNFTGHADPRYRRWLELDAKAFPLDQMTA